MNWIEFHHVQPDARGGRTEADNCVALCTYTSPRAKDGCHYHVHESGRFKHGVTPDPEDFPHSHGDGKASHDAWVLRWRARYRC